MRPLTAASALGPPIPTADGGMDGIRTAVVARAGRLIELTRREFPQWAPPPFSPDVYAQAIGISIIESHELVHWDALLVPTGTTLQIICNARGRNAGRRRFSIAHELVHCFFADADERYHMRTRHRAEYYRNDEARFLERLCDTGAAELLMPQPWFAEAVQRRGRTAQAVPLLAEEFGVSLEATALRLVETASEPCAIAFFDLAAKPSVEERLGRRQAARGDTVAYRVKRAFRSPGFPYLIPEGKSVPSESAIYRASLQNSELVAVDALSFGGGEPHLTRVSAFPLHRHNSMDAPPRVVAILRVAETDRRPAAQAT